MNRTMVILGISLLCAASKTSSLGQEPQATNTVSPTVPQSIDETLLFFPSKFPDGDWAPSDLKFEDVWFAAEDGTKLHGWYCPVEDPRAVILLAHGNAGHVAARADWLRYLQRELKVSVFIFDYRGYGRSEGTPTVAGIIQDAMAARAKLGALSSRKDSEIVLMGESLGGAVVVQLAGKTAPRGLVLQSTFSSLRDVADVHFPNLAWMVPPEKLNSSVEIGKYTGPLLQSHGTNDQTIPFSLGQRVFEKSADGAKEFVAIQNADHNDWMTETYLKRLDQFISRVGAKTTQR